MLRGLKGKLMGTYFILILVSMTLMGVLVSTFLNQYFYNNLKKDLLNEAKIASHLFKQVIIQDNLLDAQQLAEQIGIETSNRITIINQEGKVLGDSAEKAEMMENHLNRQEVKMALQDKVGVSTRYSQTRNKRMMYVAVPVKYEGEMIGVARVALPLTSIEKARQRLWAIFVGGILLAVFLSAVLSIGFANRLSKPIQEMTLAAEKIAHGNFHVKTLTTSTDEIGMLGASLNTMTNHLQEQIKEIDENKSKFETVLNYMVNGLVLINDQGIIELMNPAGEELFDVSARRIKGKSHLEGLRNYKLSDLIEQVLEEGKKIKEEIVIDILKEQVMEISLVPLLTRRGKTLGVVVVFHDITEIYKAQKMRAEFVANVSHELKTPVTSVKGFAETLLDGALEDPDMAKQFIQIIYQEADRLHRLINDLLDLSRIESKHIPLHKEPLNIVDIINSILEKMKPKIEKEKQSIDLQIPDEAVFVMADQDRIEQVLINLIDNAIKYTENEGEIALTLEKQNHFVTISISDTGIGIPKEDLPRIFERFYRVDKGRSRRMGGTGLGLSIVKHIVEGHGGKVWVKSEVGKGTTFYFTLSKGKNSDINRRGLMNGQESSQEI